MRSRVTLNDRPTSSSVCSEPSPTPKRILSTSSSRGVRVFSTLRVWSLRFAKITESMGDTAFLSSMKSPRCESSSSPMGVSSEIGSWAIFMILRTLEAGRSMRSPISSAVGSRPSSWTSERLVRNGPRDRLPDPPRGIRGELVAAPVLELLDRLHQADVPFLDQVEELQAAVRVLLRDGDHEPEVGYDQLLLGALADGLALADLVDRGRDLGVRDVVALLELAQRAAVLLDAAAVQGLELLAGLLLERRLRPLDVLLEAGELPVDVLEEVDQAVAGLDAEVDRPDVLGDLGHQAVDLALDLQVLVAVRLAALLPLAQLEDLAVVDRDLLEDLQVHLDAVGGLGVERLVRIGVDELAQDALVPDRHLVETQELPQHDRVLAQGLVDQPLALLDPLGDLHLALPVEQRHGAHLAQVHADGVVRLLMAGETELGGLVFLLVEIARAARLEVVPVLIAFRAVDDVHAEVREAEIDLVQLVGKADDLLGQHLVDLVVQEIALLLAKLDELLDGAVLLFDGCETRNSQKCSPMGF